jgi:hypothetical protein
MFITSYIPKGRAIMTTRFQKLVKKTLSEAFHVYPDAIICKKDGSVEVKKSYFYTFGRDSETWAREVKDALDRENVDCKVGHENRWATWPKTSFFVAILTEAEVE